VAATIYAAVDSGLKLAIKAVGSANRLAAKLGISQQACSSGGASPPSASSRSKCPPRADARLRGSDDQARLRRGDLGRMPMILPLLMARKIVVLFVPTAAAADASLRDMVLPIAAIGDAGSDAPEMVDRK
jgi:hypothetical protein